MSPDDVLDFWLGAPATDAAAFAAKLKRWFQRHPALDDEIGARFGGLRDQAMIGALDGWVATPRGRRALIVLLDQFTRNLHRDTARAYEADPKALALALAGLDAGEARGLDFEATMFLVMPLAHAEDVALQRRYLAAVEAAAASAPPALASGYARAVDHARGYLDTIARFGRFPHRNALLGRPSTPDELTFLATPSTNG